ncbi:MAG: GDP-mannose 4,6-dehydratase [Syntrophobacteraceae bacterium]
MAHSTVLITGVTGSGGSYLAEYIHDNHPEVSVHGISRWHSTVSSSNTKRVEEKLTLHESDLTDLGSVIETLRAVNPDAIFHLASHANVRASFNTPLAVLYNNIVGTANLFEAARLTGLQAKILHCSTSEVYGKVDPRHVPITEECPLRAVSPYSVSKVTQDFLGSSYFLSYGMPIIRTRMFAYINPRRKDLFATSFAYQVARIEVGLQDELLHGNLDSVRTLIDVRDAMRAYWVALERCDPGEVYNIGGRTVISVGEFLDVLKGMAQCPIPSRVNPDLLRPADITLQIPDTSKFELQTQWKPQYSFEESVAFLLNHCRRAAKIEMIERSYE